MTIFRVLNSTLGSKPPNSTQKTRREVSSAALVERPVVWIRLCEKHCLPVVTGATIRVKAEKIRRQFVTPSRRRLQTREKGLKASSSRWVGSSSSCAATN